MVCYFYKNFCDASKFYPINLRTLVVHVQVSFTSFLIVFWVYTSCGRLKIFSCSYYVCRSFLCSKPPIMILNEDFVGLSICEERIIIVIVNENITNAD